MRPYNYEGFGALTTELSSRHDVGQKLAKFFIHTDN